MTAAVAQSGGTAPQTELAAIFKGELVFPGEANYDQDRQEANPAFQAFPLLIAYSVAFTDVALILRVARDSGVKVACRSGGHSTAGYSVNDGIVLDTSRMHDVAVNATAKRPVACHQGWAT